MILTFYILFAFVFYFSTHYETFLDVLMIISFMFSYLPMKRAFKDYDKWRNGEY